MTPEPNAPRVVLLAGPSGTGKSSLAALTGLPILRLDDFYKDGDDPTLPTVEGSSDMRLKFSSADALTSAVWSAASRAPRIWSDRPSAPTSMAARSWVSVTSTHTTWYGAQIPGRSPPTMSG